MVAETERTREQTGCEPLRLAISVEDASEALGVSRRTFDRHIAPHLRVVPAGGRKLIPVRELERYVDERAA